MKRKIWSMLAVGVLAVSACGSSESEPLPTNQGDDPPVVEGACLPDEPDCTDTVVVGEPLPTNPGDDAVVVEGACVPDEPDCTDTVVVGEPLPTNPGDDPPVTEGPCLPDEPECEVESD